MLVVPNELRGRPLWAWPLVVVIRVTVCMVMPMYFLEVWIYRGAEYVRATVPRIPQRFERRIGRSVHWLRHRGGKRLLVQGKRIDAATRRAIKRTRRRMDKGVYELRKLRPQTMKRVRRIRQRTRHLAAAGARRIARWIRPKMH